MIECVLIAAIVVIQLAAVALGLYWLRGPGWQRFWLAAIILSAIVGAFRRSALVIFALRQGNLSLIGTFQELTALLFLSLLMLAGVVMVHLMFVSIKKTNAALRERETTFRGMIENLPGVVYRCRNDKARTVLYVSDAVTSLTGYRAVDFIEKPLHQFIDIIHQDDQSIVASIREQIVAHKAYDINYRLRQASGEVIWVNDRGKGFYDKEDNLLWVDGFIRDITERMQTAQLLRQQRDLALALGRAKGLEHILELCMAAAMDMADMDAGGVYLLDRERGALRLACHAGLPEQFIEAASYFTGDTAQTQLVRHGRPVYTCYEGGTLDFDGPGVQEGLKALAIIPVLHDSEVIACLNLASHSKVTTPQFARSALETLAGQIGQAIARGQSEQVQREQMENLTTLFTSIQDMLYVLDRQGSILRVNPAVNSLLGLTEQEILAKTVYDIHPPQYHAEVAKVAADVTAGLTNACSLPVKTKDGREIAVETHIVAGQWDGRPAFFGMARDITERLKQEATRLSLERQVLHGQKLESLGLLSSGIAHDFNNMLTAIVIHVDLALNGMDETDPRYRHLEGILKTTDHATALCKLMLDYAGEGPFVSESFYIHTLVSDMESLLVASISKMATLSIDMPEQLPPVAGDMSQLRQVLMNLVINASEAIGANSGTIRLSASTVTCYIRDLLDQTPDQDDETVNCVCIEVSDTGCGMAKDMLERIYDPFFTTKVAGRGLGMAAVQGVIRSHKGGIQVDSTLGQGTTFRILLPVSDVAPSLQQTSMAPVAAPQGALTAGGTILFVDDDAALRELGEIAGEMLGFQVITAADGCEAVDIYREKGNAIGLVILDMTMPNKDGETTFRELLEMDPEVRVIVSSGFSLRQIEKRFSGVGFLGVLQKPYSIMALKARLEEMMKTDSE